ncbi:winged helix-turn-helix transcriptional regulator [Fodinicurvata fenggangensis]|uniref:winged helix-turn-helix transcriptional regulator n=1 Tax=Fodinicurvata fenggangensis TaxID=1121830 RepID=UPI00068C2FF2|nr:winged helix-turn-helix transcriptional regulator [Fodinicurvata fenggangensis]
MFEDSGYGQFCPVAKAAEILATRWTPLILRELISGSSRFNDIHRGVPLMPRALLSRRLKELQAAGIVERVPAEHSKNASYVLTQAGADLRPIIVSMGIWGRRWVESALEGPDWDAGVLMWDMRRRVDIGCLERPRIVLQFEYHDAPAEMRRWWLLIENGAIDLCQSDPGFEVDLYVLTTVRVMSQAWIGKLSLGRAIANEEIVLHGDAELRRNFSRLLQLSVIVEATSQPPRMQSQSHLARNRASGPRP